MANRAKLKRESVRVCVCGVKYAYAINCNLSTGKTKKIYDSNMINLSKLYKHATPIHIHNIHTQIHA